MLVFSGIARNITEEWNRIRAARRQVFTTAAPAL